MKNFVHLKLRYIDSCNFLTKRTLVGQPSTLLVAKDSNISDYLNLSMYLPTIILAILWYTPNDLWLSLINELKFDDYHHQIN